MIAVLPAMALDTTCFATSALAAMLAATSTSCEDGRGGGRGLWNTDGAGARGTGGSRIKGDARWLLEVGSVVDGV